MTKHLLVLILALFSALSADSQESDYNSSSSFTIEFDDFPDNSIPDLGNCNTKELDDFVPVHNTADAIDGQSELGADFNGFPNAVINGVNVITGTFQDSATDYELPGAMPLKLQRSYSGKGGAGCEKQSLTLNSLHT